MTTESPLINSATRRCLDAGFTLIEVLVAMVILSIGLLGLQALGIGAFKAVHSGQKSSEYAVVASEHMERAVAEVRGAPSDVTYPHTHEDKQVVVDRLTFNCSEGLYEIEIAVDPVAERASVDPGRYTLTSYARSPDGEC